MKTGAVIVAAGMSSRMGDFKPMLKIGAISMVQRIIANFQQAGVFPIVIVTGYRSDELEKHISKTGVICVRNEEYATTQMYDSAKIGFTYIIDKCDRTFFTPVDIPLFTVDTIIRLMKSDTHIAKPVCNGVVGHPILISGSVLPALIAAGADGGLKKAIDELGAEVEKIEVSDDGVLQDADTPEDYRMLVERHNRQLFRPSVEISLMCENKLFDKSGALLLRMIEYTGTVRGACEKMQISYSKGWSMLSTLEKNLGFALLDRQPGGEYGGGSQLTSAGRDLLARYEDYAEKVRRFADECFAECFKTDADMPKDFPGDEEIRELWNTCETPDDVRAHCLAVCEEANRIGEGLADAGYPLSLEQLRAAALLHDLCRQAGKEHAALAARIIRERGYLKVARMVEQHHEGGFKGDIDEAQVLYLADKRIDGSRKVTIQERFDASRIKCATEEARQRHESRYREALQIEDRINRVLGGCI